MIRQYFTEANGAHGPLTRLAQRLLQCCTDAKAVCVTVEALTFSVTLEAKAAQEVTLVIAPVSETRNVNTGRAATINIFVEVPRNISGATQHVVVIHYIVAKLTRAGTQTVVPDITGGIHQNPCRVKSRRIQENNLAFIDNGFPRFCINDFYTGNALFVFVVNEFFDNRHWTQSKVTGFQCGGKSGRLSTEVAAPGTTRPAFIPVLALTAALFRAMLGNVGSTAHDHMTLAFVLLFQACSQVFLYGVHFKRGQEVTIR